MLRPEPLADACEFGIDLGLGLETQYILVAVYFVFTTIMMMIGVSRARPLLAFSP